MSCPCRSPFSSRPSCCLSWPRLRLFLQTSCPKSCLQAIAAATVTRGGCKNLGILHSSPSNGVLTRPQLPARYLSETSCRSFASTIVMSIRHCFGSNGRTGCIWKTWRTVCIAQGYVTQHNNCGRLSHGRTVAAWPCRRCSSSTLSRIVGRSVSPWRL